MAYVVYSDSSRIGSDQQAERTGQLFWPTVRLGTFGQPPAREPRSSGCPGCVKAFKPSSEKALALGGSVADLAAEYQKRDRAAKRMGWIIGGTTVLVTLALLAATVSLGKAR